MYTCSSIYLYKLELDCISFLINSYDIQSLFVTYWWYKQSICIKISYNLKVVTHFSHSFIIYNKIIS